MLTAPRKYSARRLSVTLLWLVALWTLLRCATAFASPEDKLFEARVPVGGPDASARNQALGAALSEVLVRVSGNLKAPQHPALARVILNAQRLVQRYNYETVTVPPSSTTPVPQAVMAPTSTSPDKSLTPAPAATGLVLHANFDRPGVVRVLSAAGFRVWAEPRPQSLLWLALEAGTDRTLLGSDAPPPMNTLLQAAATRRGLPILYPLLDLEDAQKIQFSDVADHVADHISAASQRYQPDAVVTAYLRETAPGQYDARWNLYRQDGSPEWQAQGTLEQVINAGIDGTADILAGRPPATPEDNAAMQLRVSGITDLDRFADVEHYLAALPGVQHLRTLSVDATTVSYAVELSDTPQVVQEAIAQGALLAPDSDAPTGEVLHYHLTQ